MARVVARAMQTYGMYVFDNGPTFAVSFQNLGPTGGIWASPDLIGIVDVRNIPVERFRVLHCETVAKDPTATVEESVEFVTTPRTIVAGEIMEPIVVRLVDGAGQPVFTGREFDVMLNIGMWEGTSPGRAELSGKLFKTTIDGTAVFEDLAIDTPGSGFRLFAMPRDLVVAVTQPFTVSPRSEPLLFSDGFESGDTLSWSSTVP